RRPSPCPYTTLFRSAGVAMWTLIAVAALSGGALAILAVGGVFAASDNGPSPAWGLWLLVGITAAIAVAMAFALRRPGPMVRLIVDRKSTRLHSSHQI